MLKNQNVFLFTECQSELNIYHHELALGKEPLKYQGLEWFFCFEYLVYIFGYFIYINLNWLFYKYGSISLFFVIIYFYYKIGIVFFITQTKNHYLNLKKNLYTITLIQHTSNTASKMSLSRKTYSPMSHTYSYSSTTSPTYSYSRVTSYLDALERDETINKLKRQITDVRSLQMKYHALLQEISLAQKQNKLLQTKNTNVEQDYIDRIQKVRESSTNIQKELNQVTNKLKSQENTVTQVEQEIQSLLSQLKSLQQQQQQTEEQNSQLTQQIKASTQNLSKLLSQKQQLSVEKASFSQQTKQSALNMEEQMQKIIQASQQIKKHEEELQLLNKQFQAFKLQTQNVEAGCEKNTAIIQNLERKVVIQEGENQQLKSELQTAQKQWRNLEQKSNLDKENLYQNITKVEEQSLLLKDVLNQLDNQLETDSTQKKYLKDIAVKKAMIQGQNQQLRERIKQLTVFYSEKKARQTKLIEEINKKIEKDQLLKKGIGQRSVDLNSIRENCIKK